MVAVLADCICKSIGLTAKAACGLVNDKRHFSIASRRMLKDMAFKERPTVMDVHVTIKGKTIFCHYSFYSKLSEQRPLTDGRRGCSHILSNYEYAKDCWSSPNKV